MFEYKPTLQEKSASEFISKPQPYEVHSEKSHVQTIRKQEAAICSAIDAFSSVPVFSEAELATRSLSKPPKFNKEELEHLPKEHSQTIAINTDVVDFSETHAITEELSTTFDTAFITRNRTQTTSAPTTATNTTTHASDTEPSENQQQSSNDSVQRELDNSGTGFVLINGELCNISENNYKASEGITIEKTIIQTDISEEFKISEGEIRTAITDQRAYRENKQQLLQQQESCSEPVVLAANSSPHEKLGYQLRALREDISALEANPWIQAPNLPQIIHSSSLSNELVNETLNYFVNCGQRLSQMTKTYDDNDAYLLLLQEKEVDLELAARIGQDLLKQNKQLRESIKNLEDELQRRQEDVQQLKHELASKTSLLDTFIEEEEHQTGRNGSEEDLTYKQHDYSLDRSTSTPQQVAAPNLLNNQHLTTASENLNDECQNGFMSLDHQQQLLHGCSKNEPFSSLPYHINKASNNDPNQTLLTRDDTCSSICDELNSHSRENQRGLMQSVTFQLVESNKRLCELQDEIFYKGEQNLIQQEKLYHLQEQLRETDRRLDNVSNENETLHRTILESAEIRKELSDELKVCKNNFSELLKVFLELQKESRLLRMRDLQQTSNAKLFESELVMDSVTDFGNVSFDSFNSAAFDYFNSTHSIKTNDNYPHNHNPSTTRPLDSGNPPVSSSLLEELQESMGMKQDRREEDDSDSDSGDATDSAESRDSGDSGVHTNNISKAVTPTAVGTTESDTDCTEPTDGDLDEIRRKKQWLGFSSFMLTTLLLLCLSVTFTSPSNFNLASKLQIKLDR